MHRARVVLPHPLAPSNAPNSPPATSRDRSGRAWEPPYDFLRWRMERSARDMLPQRLTAISRFQVSTMAARLAFTSFQSNSRRSCTDPPSPQGSFLAVLGLTSAPFTAGPRYSFAAHQPC